jgi:integrating conjugative element protein (TIGR03765 family)
MEDISKAKKILFFILWLCLFTTGLARGEPLVIRDYGGRDSGVPNKNSIAKLAQQYSVKPHVIDKATRYPIRSSLHPGYINRPQALREPIKGVQPFFIIGNDDFSRDWLTKNKTYLQKIGAQGLATNIDSNSIFATLEQLAAPLPLVAVPVDEIATILHLSVYPVLVTGEEIAQ